MSRTIAAAFTALMASSCQDPSPLSAPAGTGVAAPGAILQQVSVENDNSGSTCGIHDDEERFSVYVPEDSAIVAVHAVPLIVRAKNEQSTQVALRLTANVSGRIAAETIATPVSGGGERRIILNLEQLLTRVAGERWDRSGVLSIRAEWMEPDGTTDSGSSDAFYYFHRGVEGWLVYSENEWRDVYAEGALDAATVAELDADRVASALGAEGNTVLVRSAGRVEPTSRVLGTDYRPEKDAPGDGEE